MVGYIHATAADWKLEWATRPPGGPVGQAAPATAISRLPAGLALASTPAGDVVAAWLEDDDSGTARVRSLIYDASPPVMGDVRVPGSGRVVQALAMSATAADAFSPVSFGDGGTSTGAQVSHAFGSARRFDVSVTATDAAGNASSAGRTASVTDPRPRFIGRIRLAHAPFRAARRGHSAVPARRRRALVGSRVSFRLSEAATVRFTVQRAPRATPLRQAARRLHDSGRRGENSLPLHGAVAQAQAASGPLPVGRHSDRRERSEVGSEAGAVQDRSLSAGCTQVLARLRSPDAISWLACPAPVHARHRGGDGAARRGEEEEAGAPQVAA